MFEYCKSEIVRVEGTNNKQKSRLRKQAETIDVLEKRNKFLEHNTESMKSELERVKLDNQELNKKIKVQTESSHEKLLNQALIFDHHRQLLEERVRKLTE